MSHRRYRKPTHSKIPTTTQRHSKTAVSKPIELTGVNYRSESKGIENAGLGERAKQRIRRFIAISMLGALSLGAIGGAIIKGRVDASRAERVQPGCELEVDTQGFSVSTGAGRLNLAGDDNVSANTAWVIGPDGKVRDEIDINRQPIVRPGDTVIYSNVDALVCQSIGGVVVSDEARE